MAILEGKRPPIPDNLNEAQKPLVALIQDCWASKAEDRPSSLAIVCRLEEMAQKLAFIE